MRITNSQITSMFLEAVEDRRESVAKIQTHIATNQAILSPSDSPDGAVQAMSLRNSLSRLDQMQTTFETSRRHLSLLDTTLVEMSSLLTEGKTLAIQGGNDTNGADERRRFATRIDGLIRDMTALANSRVDGVYLLGGTDSDAPPYVLTETDDLVSDITANTSPTSDRQRDLGHGEMMSINIPGEDILGAPADVFGVLIDLRDALNNNDSTAVREAVGQIDTALAQVADANVVAGNRLRRLDLIEQQTDNEVLTLKSAQSEIEDIDLAETILALKSNETALDAALAIGSRLLPRSLLDFIQ